LGPFQGKPACLRIPLERGVCGASVRLDRTMRVPDVHAFPGHIACDEASRSELVCPVRAGGRILGVIDLDSARPGRFGPEEQRAAEALSERYAAACDWSEGGYSFT